LVLYAAPGRRVGADGRRRQRSRSTETTGHDAETVGHDPPKRAVTMNRNRRSRCAETIGHDAETAGHDGPKYPYNQTVQVLRNYRAQEVKGGLGTGGQLSVQGGATDKLRVP
jgi:hypothetical protein